MDRDSFILHVKADDIYKDIADKDEKWFDTSNYEIDRPFLQEKSKSVIGLMKNKLGWQIMKKFVGFRAKTYSYLEENNDEGKKQKGQKICVLKRNLNSKTKKNI